MVSQQILFTESDCEFIKSFYRKEVEKTEKGFKIVTEKYPEGIYIKDGSIASWNEIQNEELNRFLINKLQPLSIIGLPTLKLVRYSIGSKMVPHKDFQTYDTDPIYRSATIQLSSCNEYKGGELYVEGTKASNIQGTVVMFNPYQQHWVTEITQGERWAIVAFLQESHFDKIKNLI